MRAAETASVFLIKTKGYHDKENGALALEREFQFLFLSLRSIKVQVACGTAVL